MTSDQRVAAHYGHGSLISTIETGLAKLGLTSATVTLDDLAPVDEFHIGGRSASRHFLDQLCIRANMKLLDVGCGLGGGARFTAATYGAEVTGIDLTPEYIETGKTICRWVGLADRVTLHEGSALSMPFPSLGFDAAYMMHVGMNVDSKDKLFAEIHRVLVSGAPFGIYDIMKTNAGDLAYPVPWAASEETSWLAGAGEYKTALEAAGFVVTAETDRRDFALEFFRKMSDTSKTSGGPPALSLHTLMQQTTKEKIGNMVANITAGLITPIELIAVKL